MIGSIEVTKNKVKKNINLLEKPLFIPSRTRIKQSVYEDNKGYTIATGHNLGLPVAYDINILNHFLMRAQKIKSNRIEYKSINYLLSEITGNRNNSKKAYDLLDESIGRWTETRITFKANSFYLKQGIRINKDKIPILGRVRENKYGLLIVIDEDFYNLNIDNYSMSIPTKILDDLSPYTKRLFEILIKNYKGRDEWKIKHDLLTMKLPVLTKMDRYDKKRIISSGLDEIEKTMNTFGYAYKFEATESKRENSNNSEEITIKKVRA